jgi:hypothetical protein
MNAHLTNDPVPDPRLAEELNALDGEPPIGAVDWERLRGSIRERAALPLARRRSTGHEMLRRWASPALRAAAAAAVLLALVLQWEPLSTEPGAEASVAGGVRPVAEDVLGAPIPQREWELLLATRADTDALLLAAVDGL